MIYTYPTQVELTQIAAEKTERLTSAGRLGFQLCPLTDKDQHFLAWEQKDNYKGLQQLRGLDGRPTRVQKVGAKRFLMEPGVYGEFMDIDEQEMTALRPLGQFNGAIDLTDLVMDKQDQLLLRRLDRLEWIIWTLITTGTFAVASPVGGFTHTDIYPVATYSALIAWATVATAHPFADFRAIKLLDRGKGVSFGRGARYIMNQTTYNTMSSNTNANDLGGKRITGLAPVNNLTQINGLLVEDTLGTIEIYDEGYIDDSGTFQLFVPDNKVIVVGARAAGQRIMEYRLTRNVNNPGNGAGPYQKVIDTMDREVPRRVSVHDGHNGGPVMFYPGSILIMSV